jgi:hypothetical protein
MCLPPAEVRLTAYVDADIARTLEERLRQRQSEQAKRGEKPDNQSQYVTKLLKEALDMGKHGK